MTASQKADALRANPYAPDPECNHVSGGFFRRHLDSEGDYTVSRCKCWLKWKGLDRPEVRDHKAVAAGGGN